MRKTLLSLCFIASIVCGAFAQVSQGGEPTTWNGKAEFPVVFERMDSFNEESMREEDAINNASKDVPYRFGKNFDVNYGIANSGNWHELPSGDRVWLLGIESEGAWSINFIFDQFYMPHGAELFIYNEDHSQLLGAFTEENNNADHTFSTYPIQGDKVILEYYEPQRVMGMGELRLETVTHAYRDIEAIARGLGDSGSCNNNVICPVSAGWENEINSVAMIVVNGNGICTGALVNNTANDGHPYFLTANHCTGGGVTNWVFRFNWQSPSCASNSTSNFDTVSGSQLLASGGSADYCLLRINNGNPIPTGYNPYYAGWDASGAGPSSSVAIHHPSGDIKKISFDYDAAGTASYGGATCWRIFDWEDGTTEPGSSGSPLFNQDHRIVGQLYGGQASCSNNINDYYGKFDVTFPNVCNWLAPGCGTTVIDGYDPNTPTVALDAQLQTISSPSGTICGSSVTPEVQVRNAGSTTLNSFTLNYNVDGGANQSFNWSGTLASGSSIVITLPSISPSAGGHTFNVSVTSPNGGTDENTSNDSASSAFTMNPGGSAVTFTLLTDCWGEETSWTLEEQGGAVIQSVSANSLGDLTTYTYDFCLADGCYDLIIGDTYGDGVEGSLYGSCGVDGNYTVTDGGGAVLVQMASAAFGTGITESFCVTGSGDILGCTDPTACNYNSSATVDDGSCIAAPQGDVCTDAIPITVNGGFLIGSNANTCFDGPEPGCGGTGIKDIWYSFTYSGGNIEAFTNLATLTDTRLAIYDACGGSQIACNDDNGTLASTINLTCDQLTIGTTYYLQVGGYNALTGSFYITVNSTPSDGCTDPAACNYDPAATCDDGSCILPDGCTDPTACNYNPAATCDDGSCVLPDGCTNPTACNYDPAATCDNGSCILPDGCTDMNACNYNPAATCDDGSCVLPDGCTDPAACNFDPAATCDDGSCVLPDGCTDPTACNYDPAATCDNGSCILPDGCTDMNACNYDPAATCDDGSCVLPDGCTDPTACNYDPAATCDDGTCILPDGCTDSAACNYDPAALCDDGSCQLPDGCTDPTACNYDPAASCDDGTCTFGTTWYEDLDGDGVGSAVSTVACTQPTGYVSSTGDCDDNNSAVYPGAPPTAEGIDNDCNGTVDPDEEVAPCYGDLNNDGTRNVADLLALLGNMGCTGAGCAGDLNNDNIVNTGDMVSFLGIYGTDCP